MTIIEISILEVNQSMANDSRRFFAVAAVINIFPSQNIDVVFCILDPSSSLRFYEAKQSEAQFECPCIHQLLNLIFLLIHKVRDLLVVHNCKEENRLGPSIKDVSSKG